MGIEIMEMSMKLRKFGIFLLRKSYRSVYNHPFLVCILLFLVFLYRSSPFLFSLLVSASPVLVCTAVLLGILLSFGQPNLQEIENDEKFVNETGSIRTGIRTDTIVVAKSEESSIVEKVTHKNLEITEHLNDDTDFVADIDKLDSSASFTEGSREIQDVVDRKSKVVNEDDELEFETDKSPAESIDSKRVNVDSLDSPPDSPWKHVEEEERGGGGGGGGGEAEEDEDEDDDDDDDSDQAESSSPDASMADIIPLLDELHPLLDDDTSHPVPFSHDGSDAASERSDESNDSGSGSISDDNIEKLEDLEEEEEGVEDEEEQYNKESETKTAITWTEEDQKNLMDLGSSELERNQRLESLIARRRAKKCVSMMPERNLIDFDSTDLPFNMAPISTSRNNPFDIGHDSYGNNTNLPPIPGSAPSILLPRRNPFDIPYDSSEEKPNLMTDSFHQEFSSSQQKDMFFRRRESFNVGPSFFGPNRYDNNSRFKPFFVPEKSYLEESSYSPFQRQSSGLSDSKASSVPETDSVVSTGDIEENNNLVVEDNVTQNTVAVNFVPELELTSQTGNLESKNSFGEDIYEALEEPENSNLGDEDSTQETEVIVKMEDVSEHVGHGSQSSSSSEDESSLENDEAEDRETGVDNGNDIHKAEQLKLHKDADVTPLSVEGRDFNEETQIPPGQHSLLGSDTNKEIGSMGGDPHHNHKEPIYDSSPTKNASSSSILSEINAESNMMGFPPVLIKGPVSFAEIESESEGPKLEGTTNTSKIDLQLREEGSDSATIMPVATEFSGSGSLVGTSIDADPNVESTGSSSRNIDAVISAGSSSENTDALISVELDEKEIHSNGQNSTEDNISFPDFGEELIFLDRNMDETPQEETVVMQEELSEESSPRESLNVSDIQDIETEAVSANVNFQTSPESINIPSEAYESRAVECYSDDEFENEAQFHAMDNREMQNIDCVEEIVDDLLSELDTVGDFSVKNLDSGGLDAFETETHVASHEEDKDLSALNMAESSSKHDDLDIPQKKTVSAEENEPEFVESSKVVENSDLEDFDIEMPLIEAQSLEDIKSVFEKSETSTNGEIAVDSSEELHEDQDSKKSTAFEARSMDDIETIIKKTESTDENLVDESVKPHEDQTSSMDVSSEMPVNEETQSTTDIQKQPIETINSKTPVDSDVLVSDEQSNENESVARVSINNSVGMNSDANVPEASNDQQLSMKQQPVLRENTDVNSDAEIAITEEGSVVLHEEDNEKHSKNSNSSSSDSNNESK